MIILDTKQLPLPYQVLSYYPHLSPPDTELWTRFIKANPDYAQLAYYDLPVGTIDGFDGQETNGWQERHIFKSYSKRIDVTILHDTHCQIIEVKPHAGYIALGQILMYAHCIKDLLPTGTPIIATILTDKADPDLIVLADDLDVQIIELDK